MNAFREKVLQDPHPELRFLIVIWKVARVLQRIHEKKLIHRDIKPENIFLGNNWEPENPGENWEPVVGDFGIATDLTLTGYVSVAGDPRYMAPEQVQGQKSFKSDVYSLGRILQEILKIGQGQDENLEKIIEKATCEDIARRYSSQKLCSALEDIIWPRVEKLLDNIVSQENWDRVLKWLDFCWELAEQKRKAASLSDKFLEP